jgi:hypothetical protein
LGARSAPGGRGPWKVRVNARQQQADVGIGGDGLVRQRRIAGAEDAVRRAVDVELGLHRRLHNDVGKYAETLGLERLGDTFDDIVEPSFRMMLNPYMVYLLFLVRIAQQVFDERGNDQNNNDPDGNTHV